ncbi:hypothetical protein OKW43_007761 [Paraburkholderia sp. WC7.3g]
MRGRITIERDGLRWLPLMLDCLFEKGFCRLHVAPGAEHEVYRLACPIHRPIKIDPLAAQFEISLVDAPRLASGPAKAVPPFNELRRIAPHPAQDRRVRQRETSFRHHFDQIAQAKLVAQIPANTQNDHFTVKVTACEQFVQALQFAHRRLSICSVRHLNRFARALFAPEPCETRAGSRRRGNLPGLYRLIRKSRVPRLRDGRDHGARSAGTRPGLIRREPDLARAAGDARARRTYRQPAARGRALASGRLQRLHRHGSGACDACALVADRSAQFPHLLEYSRPK